MPEHTDAQLAALACAHLSLRSLTEQDIWRLTQAVRHSEQDGQLALSERAVIYHIIFRCMETITL